MQPDLLRVVSSHESFLELFSAGRARKVLIGWLDLESASRPPSDLAEAAANGALRAVSITGRDVVSVKRLGGSPVLRDVVREHFTGCRLLLVRGDVEAAVLAPASGGWTVQWQEKGEASFSTAEFFDALRSPKFIRGDGR